MKNYWTIFTNGLVKENPLLVLMIGLCSSLAVTTSFSNGLGMGLAMTFVLLMSEIIISLFRKLIPDSIRIPVFIIVIATFVTIVDLLMQAYVPALAKSLGVKFSLAPYSSVGYKMKVGDETQDHWADIGRVMYGYSGEGDISEVKLSLGWAPWRNFSIGV